MQPVTQLSPGEVVVLLDPCAANGRECLKVTVLAMLLDGALRPEKMKSRGIFGEEKDSEAFRLGSAPAAQNCLSAAVYSALRSFSGQSFSMTDLVQRLRNSFGTDFSRFLGNIVRPALVARGLIEEHKEKVFWFISIKSWRATSAGAVEADRIRSALKNAHRIPEFLRNDPAEAAALIATLGLSVLLVAELRPHLSTIASHLGPVAASTGGGDGYVWMDWPSWTAFDSSVGTFDGSFDASASADAGGGDGGGGD